jgi:hypothetical protein
MYDDARVTVYTVSVHYPYPLKHTPYVKMVTGN